MINTQPNLETPDDFYEALISTHSGLSVEESHALNARLLLLLANHIGSQAVLQNALAIARGMQSGDEPAPFNPTFLR